MSIGGVVGDKDIANLFMEHFKVESPERPSRGLVLEASDGCDTSVIHFTTTDVAPIIDER